MTQSPNPFAAPQTASLRNESLGGDLEQAEQIRREHLNHEASLKSIGVLYYIGAFFSAVGVVIGSYAIFAGGEDIRGLLFLPLYAAFGFAGGLGGYWLRRLDPRAKFVVGPMAGLGLIAFPFGTIINGYILWLAFSRKGAVVFSPEYKEVIRQTPHIKYRTSWIVIALLILLLLVLAAAIILPLVR